jgi:hypothetical protein
MSRIYTTFEERALSARDDPTQRHIDNPWCTAVPTGDLVQVVLVYSHVLSVMRMVHSGYAR